MDDKLVTIASHLTGPEAHLAKNSLETEGIPAFLADEQTDNALGLVVGFVHGVKLLVAEQHAERAGAILATLSENPADAPPDERLATTRTCPVCGDAFDPDLDYCPVCGPPAAVAVEAARREEDEEGPFADGDELARRALWSSVLGVTFCPGVMTAYAMYLLLRICFGKEEPSPRGWTKVYFAFGFCAASLAYFLLWWRYLARI
jgi:hypothetical protein